MGKRKLKKTNGVPPRDNLVVISDTHIGCGLALCHPDGFRRDEGGMHKPNKPQKQLWEWWEEFWGEFVPRETQGAPYSVVHAADIIDGVHHGSTTQISQNLTDQGRHARKILKPLVEECEGRYYQLRGTEAHSGKSAQEEEAIAEAIGAVPDQTGRFSRDDLWIRVGGKQGGLVHVMHHIGSTSSSAYESSAPMRELTEEFVEAGRWGDEPPRVVVRAHRHRHLQVHVPSKHGSTMAVTTPAWQLKTSLAFRIAGARVTQPQIGGILIRYHKDVLYIRPFVKRPRRSREIRA